MQLSTLNLALNRPGGLTLWQQAALSLDLAGMSSLPAGWSFTRASSGTYVDAAGVLKTASSGAPRFTHDSFTLQPLGYLTEHQRTNLLLHSDDLSETAWTTSSASVTSGVAGAPTDTAVASSVIEDAGAANHTVWQAITNTNTSAFTGSVWLKANGRTWARMQLDFDTQYRRVWVNLSTGGLGLEEGTATQVVAARAERYLNGWVRVWLTASSASGATRGMTIGPASSDGVTSYTGDGSSGILVFGAQLEYASSVSSYIRTTTASATRERDVAYFTAPAELSRVQAVTLCVESISMEGLDTDTPNLTAAALVDQAYEDLLSIDREDSGAYRFGARATLVRGEDGPFNVLGETESLLPFVRTRAALASDAAATMQFAVNGVLSPESEVMDLSGWSVDELWLGVFPFEQVSSHNGTIARVGVWNRKLASSELVLLTQPQWVLSLSSWSDDGGWVDSAVWGD